MTQVSNSRLFDSSSLALSCIFIADNAVFALGITFAQGPHEVRRIFNNWFFEENKPWLIEKLNTDA
jgi:hypothetical protein